MKPPEKLCLVHCFAVVVYRPYRVKKGHYVWRRYKVITQPEFDWFAASKKYPTAKRGSIHNRKLTENETIKAIASGL